MSVALPPVPHPAHGEGNTYAQILKSTALIGGSSALNIAIGILRTKAMAVLLGPAGIGLIGVYNAIADLARSVAQMGVNSSGVRQIAEAVASGQQERIARTVTVLRRIGIVLGLAGAVLLIAFSGQVSTWTFGNDHHAAPVAWLSLAVFFRLVADGHGALAQGMRRIADLAKMGVVGALAGTVISIALVAFLREDGIVPSLVSIAAVSVLVSWWYSRAIKVTPAAMTGPELRKEAASLLKLGLAFMASALLTMGAAFAVRLIVLRHAGLDAAGLYQAAWTLGGLYVGFVLQALGADFYPRLVGIIADKPRSNQLVNEQSQVSLLLAGPGVIATLTFASLVIAVFYTTEFGAAVDLLRWTCLGMALRVITWPLGFIVVAHNLRLVFFATELAWTVVNVGLSWLCIGWFGLTGAGIAFFGSYVFHAVMVVAVVRRLSGFRWSPAIRKTGLIFAVSTGVVFVGFYMLAPLWAMALGTLVLAASSGYSAHGLLTLVAPERIPRPLRRLLMRGPLA